MNYYKEPTRDIPIIDTADVIVTGGGVAGFAAAVSAARMGMKTILIEQAGSVGGMATTGLMSHWTGNTKGGFYEELLNISKDCGEDIEDDFARQIINPEKLKMVMLDMLYDAGVILKLYTMVCQVITEDSCIKGVITESKSGRQAVMGKIIIDASGDGDAAAMCGVPYIKGRESDNKMQPMTLMFKVAGVDTKRGLFPGGFEDTYELPKGDLQTLGKKILPHPAGHVLLYRTTLTGVMPDHRH